MITIRNHFLWENVFLFQTSKRVFSEGWTRYKKHLWVETRVDLFLPHLDFESVLHRLNQQLLPAIYIFFILCFIGSYCRVQKCIRNFMFGKSSILGRRSLRNVLQKYRRLFQGNFFVSLFGLVVTKCARQLKGFVNTSNQDPFENIRNF